MKGLWLLVTRLCPFHVCRQCSGIVLIHSVQTVVYCCTVPFSVCITSNNWRDVLVSMNSVKYLVHFLHWSSGLRECVPHTLRVLMFCLHQPGHWFLLNIFHCNPVYKPIRATGMNESWHKNIEKSSRHVIDEPAVNISAGSKSRRGYCDRKTGHPPPAGSKGLASHRRE